MKLLKIGALLGIFLLASCGSEKQLEYSARSLSNDEQILVSLLDPKKLDSLTSERGATPRLRKICFYLHTAENNGQSVELTLQRVFEELGAAKTERSNENSRGLVRNMNILQKLGCLDEPALEKLKRGKAPTVTRGPYAGQIATVDHIIPRSICPELDNKLYNLEFMPQSQNSAKGAKITERQVSLATRWSKSSLISSDGLEAVVARFGKP